MPEPRVSVVVPTHDRAADLAGLLDALAACDRPDGGVEIVVVDDGSSDGTPDVLAAAPGVRAVRQANAGAAAARNRGWRASTGDLVLFLDDDCRPEPGWIRAHVEALDAGLDGTGGTIVPDQCSTLASFVTAERLVDHGLTPDGIGVRYLVTANAGFRRAALEAVDGFDESFPGAAGEDVDLSVRLTKAGFRLGLAPDAVVAHRHPDTLRAVLRTYRKHGAARPRLEAAHGAALGSAAVSSLVRPGRWIERYGRYRRTGLAPTWSAALLAVRAAGLAVGASSRRAARAGGAPAG